MRDKLGGSVQAKGQQVWRLTRKKGAQCYWGGGEVGSGSGLQSSKFGGGAPQKVSVEWNRSFVAF